jgi:hypothetical protein
VPCCTYYLEQCDAFLCLREFRLGWRVLSCSSRRGLTGWNARLGKKMVKRRERMGGKNGRETKWLAANFPTLPMDRNRVTGP